VQVRVATGALMTLPTHPGHKQHIDTAISRHRQPSTQQESRPRTVTIGMRISKGNLAMSTDRLERRVVCLVAPTDAP
jgi:hypothetical protein